MLKLALASAFPAVMRPVGQTWIVYATLGVRFPSALQGESTHSLTVKVTFAK